MATLYEYWQWLCWMAKHEEEEMPIIVNEGDGKRLPPCPEGLHQAVCVDVVDLGMVETMFGKKHKLKIVWQVVPFDDDGKPMVREDGSRYQVQNWYTASLHKKAMLHQHLHAWRGKRFSDEELKAFDVEKLLGANCQIQVIHSPPKDGEVYANVQAIVPHKGKDKLVPQDYIRVKDREDGGNGNGHVEAVEEEEEPLPF